MDNLYVMIGKHVDFAHYVGSVCYRRNVRLPYRRIVRHITSGGMCYRRNVLLCVTKVFMIKRVLSRDQSAIRPMYFFV